MRKLLALIALLPALAFGQNGTISSWTNQTSSSGASGAASITSGSITGLSTFTVADNVFTLQDDGDATKQVRFQLSGLTTGNTRTFTLPDASGTLLYSGGPLGTPASGTVTNLTGTASININGTVGATTPAAGTFTTVTNGALTATRIPFAGTAGLMSDSANLTFNSGNRTLTLGAGSTSTAGWVFDAASIIGSGWAVIYPTAVTPSSSNYVLANVASQSILNGLTNVQLAAGGTTKLTISATAGDGGTLAGGTAVAATVCALCVTRTNNNALVDTGVKFTFTDTTSAAGFLPFQILGGAAGSTNLFNIDKIGSGTFAQGITAGGAILADSFRSSANRAFMRSTVPTLASGGCTGAGMSGTQNGTALFRGFVGTGCAGSQPLVFTLAGASASWNCTARNVSNGATSNPRQTGAESTTAVTITNFGATTGLAAAWTDSDVVVVSCLGG